MQQILRTTINLQLKQRNLELEYIENAFHEHFQVDDVVEISPGFFYATTGQVTLSAQIAESFLDKLFEYGLDARLLIDTFESEKSQLPHSLSGTSKSFEKLSHCLWGNAYISKASFNVSQKSELNVTQDSTREDTFKLVSLKHHSSTAQRDDFFTLVSGEASVTSSKRLLAFLADLAVIVFTLLLVQVSLNFNSVYDTFAQRIVIEAEDMTGYGQRIGESLFVSGGKFVEVPPYSNLSKQMDVPSGEYKVKIRYVMTARSTRIGIYISAQPPKFITLPRRRARLHEQTILDNAMLRSGTELTVNIVGPHSVKIDALELIPKGSREFASAPADQASPYEPLMRLFGIWNFMTPTI